MWKALRSIFTQLIIITRSSNANYRIVFRVKQVHMLTESTHAQRNASSCICVQLVLSEILIIPYPSPVPRKNGHGCFHAIFAQPILTAFTRDTWLRQRFFAHWLFDRTMLAKDSTFTITLGLCLIGKDMQFVTLEVFRVTIVKLFNKFYQLGLK